MKLKKLLSIASLILASAFVFVACGEKPVDYVVGFQTGEYYQHMEHLTTQDPRAELSLPAGEIVEHERHSYAFAGWSEIEDVYRTFTALRTSMNTTKTEYKYIPKTVDLFYSDSSNTTLSNMTVLTNDYNYTSENINMMILPNNITTIDTTRLDSWGDKDSVFASSDFKNLNTLVIPNSVTTIKEASFKGALNVSSNRSIIIPDSVQTIEKMAFWGTNAIVFSQAASRPAGWAYVADSSYEGWIHESATVIWGAELSEDDSYVKSFVVTQELADSLNSDKMYKLDTNYSRYGYGIEGWFVGSDFSGDRLSASNANELVGQTVYAKYTNSLVGFSV